MGPGWENLKIQLALKMLKPDAPLVSQRLQVGITLKPDGPSKNDLSQLWLHISVG